MASQIPPLLEPYLSLPPEASQIVLTGILGANTNWLVLRSLYSLLRPARPQPRGDGAAPAGEDEDVRVLLVSFMRDYAFWKDGAGRLVRFPPTPSPPISSTLGIAGLLLTLCAHAQQGLNLDALTSQGRFYFVDGLSRLFLDGAAAGSAPHPAAGHGGHGHVESPRVADVARTLGAAAAQLGAARGTAGKVVLVLDQPDVLLAAAAAEEDGATGTALRDVVLDLREVSVVPGGQNTQTSLLSGGQA